MTKIREGYKETEIGVIPEDWEVCKIDEVINFLKSGLSRKLSDTDIGIPCLRSSNIVDGRLNLDDLKYWYIEDPQGAKIEEYIVDEGDILVNFINSIAQIGKTCIFDNPTFKTIYTTNVFRIKTDTEKMDNKFFFYNTQTKSYNYQISLITKPAVNQASFTTGDFKSIKFPLPPLPEQQRIAEILSTTDSHIEKLDKIIEDYQLLKKGMMKKLLTEGIGHTEFKETEIGRIPKEWEVKRLDECFEFYGGYTASRAQLTDEGRLYLHYGDIHLRIRSYIDTNEDSGWMPRYNVEKDKNGALLDTGDIVLADASEDYEGVGKSIVIIKGKEEIVAGLHTIVGKDINESFDLNYKRYFLGADYVRNQFRRLATGAKVYGISKGNIGQILVSIPCKEEQCVIGKTLARLERHIELLSNEKEELFLFKKSLMNKLLTGKVRVV